MSDAGNPVNPDRKARHAASFGAAADLYDRARPSYPDAAIDWLLPPGVRRVLDLGAGTGKLTAALVARGLDVLAVDPSAEMLARLRARCPGVATHVGTAESIPLADGDVDAVLVAQAWHWVDPARAVPEVARVLSSGGTLGLVWNVRDDTVPWIARLNDLINGGEACWHHQGEPEIGAPFAPLERHLVDWTSRLDEAGLVDLVGSRSFALTRSDEEREALIEQVRQAFRALAKAPDDARCVEVPYVTRCFRTRRET